MIGNLFGAISIAIFSSVLAIGGVKSDQVKQLNDTEYPFPTGTYCSKTSVTMFWAENYYSDDSGQIGNFYTTLDLTADVGDTYVYNYSTGNVYALTSDLTYDEVLNQFSNNNDLCVSILVQTEDWLGHTLYKITPVWRIFAWDSGGEDFPYMYNRNFGFRYKDSLAPTTYDMIFGPYPYNNARLSLNRSDIYNNTSTYGIYDFYNYAPIQDNNTYLLNNRMLCSFTIMISFDDISHQALFQFFTSCANYYAGNYYDAYETGYREGYDNGYNTGSYRGYLNGYAEGLQVSQNSSFSSLMNSIADTPLRFLYGLFNFDLFGVSALVIILSLLTLSITFVLVKKFWR